MKKIMQMSVVCLLAISTTAYAGDGRKGTKSAADKVSVTSCPPACKKTGCDKTSCNTACTKEKCGMKKS